MRGYFEKWPGHRFKGLAAKAPKLPATSNSEGIMRKMCRTPQGSRRDEEMASKGTGKGTPRARGLEGYAATHPVTAA